MMQQIERRLDRQRFSPDPETHARDGLIEQTVPGGIGRHRFLVKQLLDTVLELVGFFLAQIFEPGTIMSQRWLAHCCFELSIVETIELESKEQEMDGSGGDAFLHIRVEYRAIRIGGVARMNKGGIRNEPPHQIIQPLIAL